MSMYFSQTNNFVCNAPVTYSLNQISKPQKTHHWYDAFEFWTSDFWKGENLWHNLVSIGEVVGGLIAAPFTAGASEAGALASIAATAAVETTIGLIGAGANTAIDAAYGHATWSGGLTNFGVGIASGLTAGGLQGLGYGARGAINKLTGSFSKGVRNIFNINKAGIKELYQGNKNIFKIGFENTKGGARYLDKLLGNNREFMDKVLNGISKQNILPAINRSLKSGARELLDKTSENIVKNLNRLGTRTLEKYEEESINGVIKGSKLRLGLRSSYEVFERMFDKLVRREITEKEFIDFILTLPRADQMLFMRTWNGFIIDLDHVISKKSIQSIMDSEKIKLNNWFDRSLKMIWIQEKVFHPLKWRKLYQPKDIKLDRWFSRYSKVVNIKHKFWSTIRRKINEPLKHIWNDFKLIKEKVTLREKFKQLNRALGSSHFNDMIVQKVQLTNVSDAYREIAKTPYLIVRNWVKKGWAKMAIKMKWLRKFSKFGNMFKHYLIKGGSHVFPGSSWILGYKILYGEPMNRFIRIDFQPGPTNNKPPVFLMTNDITLHKWKKFTSPGYFYLRTFAYKGELGPLKYLRAFLPMRSLRNVISLVSNITHSIHDIAEGKYISNWKNRMGTGLKRNAINRLGWLAGDIAGMVGGTFLGHTFGRIAKAVVRKSSRYGIIPMVNHKVQQWDKVLSSTIRTEGLKRIRRRPGGKAATSNLRGRRKFNVVSSIPSAVSGGLLGRRKWKF